MEDIQQKKLPIIRAEKIFDKIFKAWYFPRLR